MRKTQIYFTSQEINQPNILQNITGGVYKANGPKVTVQNAGLLLGDTANANAIKNHTEKNTP